MHLPDRPCAAAGSRATNDTETEVPARLGDHPPIRVFADEHMDIAPRVVISRHQDVLVPESVQVTPLEVRLIGIKVPSHRPIAIAQRADPQADQPGDGEADRLDQHRMANLHQRASLPNNNLYSDGHSPLNTSTAGPVMYT